MSKRWAQQGSLFREDQLLEEKQIRWMDGWMFAKGIYFLVFKYKTHNVRYLLHKM